MNNSSGNSSWSVRKLGSLARKVGSGVTPKGGSKVYLSSGIPLIRSQNVLVGYLDLSDVVFISEEQHEFMDSTKLQPLDVLLNITGASIGRCALVPPDFTEGNVNQHVCIIRTNDQLDPVYLMQFLNSEIGQDQIWSLQAGGNRQGLNFEQIRGFDISLPPLPEQRAIAAILSTWDEAITLTRRLIEALQQRKRALMDVLLTGQVRFPGFDGEWKRTEFGGVLKESRLPGSNGAKARKLTVKLYGKGIVPKIESKLGSENTVYFTRLAGQFIYSKLDFLNGAFALIPEQFDGYETTLDLPAFDISPAVNPIFLLNYVKRENFYSSYLGSARGGRKARRVQPSEFLTSLIRLPTVTEQDQISDVLAVIEKYESLCISYFEQLQAQKRGLMQLLLTGAVRVDIGKGTE